MADIAALFIIYYCYVTCLPTIGLTTFLLTPELLLGALTAVHIKNYEGWYRCCTPRDKRWSLKCLYKALLYVLLHWESAELQWPIQMLA